MSRPEYDVLVDQYRDVVGRIGGLEVEVEALTRQLATHDRSSRSADPVRESASGARPEAIGRVQRPMDEGTARVELQIAAHARHIAQGNRTKGRHAVYRRRGVRRRLARALGRLIRQ